MQTFFEQRPIEIEEMYIASGGRDYLCDSFIEKAYWIDTKQDFTEEELDRINDGGIYEYVMDWLY